MCFYRYSSQVHADIKPDNIIIVNDTLKVTDLGLAFRLSSSRDVVRRQNVRGTLGIYFHSDYRR